MNIAIVVINKDDPGLADTLSALAALPEIMTGEAEVVVVDASNGRFVDLEARYPSVRWIPFAPLPARSSIPHQRNVGIAATSAEIVVFIDASCTPGPEWVGQITAPIASGDEDIVAGAHRSSRSGSIRDEATRRLREKTYLDEAPTINLAIRRSTLQALGGFDEAFRYGSDVDLTWRAVDNGYRIRYVPDAYVVHDWGGGRQELKRSVAYGRARALLFAKHPRRWKRLLTDDAPVVIYPLLIVISPLLLRRPSYLSVLVLPIFRNRHNAPLRTLGEHFVFGFGVLRGLEDVVRWLKA